MEGGEYEAEGGDASKNENSKDDGDEEEKGENSNHSI